MTFPSPSLMPPIWLLSEANPGVPEMWMPIDGFPEKCGAVRANADPVALDDLVRGRDELDPDTARRDDVAFPCPGAADLITRASDVEYDAVGPFESADVPAAFVPM